MRDTKHLEKHSNKLAESKKEKNLFRNLRKEVESQPYQKIGMAKGFGKPFNTYTKKNLALEM